MASLPEPDLDPDQAPEAVQLASEEDQVRVTVEPLGVLAVSAEKAAESCVPRNKTRNRKNLFIPKITTIQIQRIPLITHRVKA